MAPYVIPSRRAYKADADGPFVSWWTNHTSFKGGNMQQVAICNSFDSARLPNPSDMAYGTGIYFYKQGYVPDYMDATYQNGYIAWTYPTHDWDSTWKRLVTAMVNGEIEGTIGVSTRRHSDRNTGLIEQSIPSRCRMAVWFLEEPSYAAVDKIFELLGDCRVLPVTAIRYEYKSMMLAYLDRN